MTRLGHRKQIPMVRAMCSVTLTHPEAQIISSDCTCTKTGHAQKHKFAKRNKKKLPIVAEGWISLPEANIVKQSATACLRFAVV